ncbi:MAG: hypothetical protein K2Q26_00555 [Bdellovibrionales bacterium]|nr:hypothetical protein [Bdellovibrionales bacterium]
MAKRKEVYCGFCRLPHKVYTQKHISWLEVGGFALLSGIVSFLVWREFHPASLTIFIVGSLWAEFVIRYRWRQSVKCKNCGFDPIVYKRSPAQAADLVQAFLDNRKVDPSFLLKPQPKLPPPRKASSQDKGRRFDARY